MDVQVEVALMPDDPVEELQRDGAGDERARACLEGAEGAGAGVEMGVEREGGGEEAREEAVDVVCGAGVDRDGGVGGAAGAREAEERGGREAGEDGFGDELDVEEALGEELGRTSLGSAWCAWREWKMEKIAGKG